MAENGQTLKPKDKLLHTLHNVISGFNSKMVQKDSFKNPGRSKLIEKGRKVATRKEIVNKSLQIL